MVFWMWGILLWLIWWWLASQKKPWTLQCCARPDPAECSASAQSAPCRGAPYAVTYAGCSTCKWPWRCLNPMFMMVESFWIHLFLGTQIFHLQKMSCMILLWLGHLGTCGTAEWMPSGSIDAHREIWILWEKIRYPATKRMNHFHFQLEKRKRF